MKLFFKAVVSRDWHWRVWMEAVTGRTVHDITDLPNLHYFMAIEGQ